MSEFACGVVVLEDKRQLSGAPGASSEHPEHPKGKEQFAVLGIDQHVDTSKISCVFLNHLLEKRIAGSFYRRARFPFKFLVRSMRI